MIVTQKEQLSTTLFDLDQDGWLLYWKTPEQARERRIRRMEGITQLPLFDPDLLALAVGANEVSGKPRRRTYLHLVGESLSDQDAEE